VLYVINDNEDKIATSKKGYRERNHW